MLIPRLGRGRRGRAAGALDWPMRSSPAAFLAALLATGCATVNYTDPAGPLHTGRGEATPVAGPALKLVTFNVEYALQTAAAASGLKRAPLADADVVALQEMDLPGVEHVARALGMGYVYFPVSVHPRTRRDFGNAILSRWPLTAPRKVLLPHRSLVYNQQRAAASAVVTADGRDIRVYSVHLGAPRGTSEGRRREQVDAILADAARETGPVAVMGDLNSERLGERFVAAGFTWLTRDAGATSGSHAIDHIVVRGLPVPEGLAAGVARDVRAGDHWPVWAVVGAAPAR